MGGGNRSGPVDVAATLTAKGQRIDFEVETFIAGPAHTLRGEGFDASEDGTGRGTPLVPVVLRGHSDYGDGLPCLRAEGGDAGGGSEALIAFDPRQSDVLVYGDMTGPLDTMQPGPAIAFSCKDHGADAADELAPTLRAMGHGESHANAGGQVAVAYGITADALDRQGEGAGGTAAERSGLGITEELSPTLRAKRPNAVAYDLRGREGGAQFEGPHDTANIRAANGGSSRSYVAETWAVRRLTEDECARLQGFPDGHSRIPWRGRPAEECPAGPQYKTYGNSMAVNVMRWLGERLTANMPEAA